MQRPCDTRATCVGHPCAMHAARVPHATCVFASRCLLHVCRMSNACLPPSILCIRVGTMRDEALNHLVVLLARLQPTGSAQWRQTAMQCVGVASRRVALRCGTSVRARARAFVPTRWPAPARRRRRTRTGSAPHLRSCSAPRRAGPSDPGPDSSLRCSRPPRAAAPRGGCNSERLERVASRRLVARRHAVHPQPRRRRRREAGWPPCHPSRWPPAHASSARTGRQATVGRTSLGRRGYR